MYPHASSVHLLLLTPQFISSPRKPLSKCRDFPLPLQTSLSHSAPSLSSVSHNNPIGGYS